MNQEKCLRVRRVVTTLLFSLVTITIAFSFAACSDPEQAKAEHVRQGEAYLKEGKLQEAVIEFRNATQIDGQMVPAHWGLAQAYEKLERFGEALEALQRTVQLDPNHIDARLKLANYLLLAYNNQKNQEYLTEASRLTDEILQKDANHIDGNILLANLLAIQGKNDEALKKLQFAISLNPQRLESHLGLARFYMQIKDQAKAEAAFKTALSINDRASLALVEYGKFFVQTGRPDQAEALFKKAVEVDASNRDVLLVLASFYLVNKKLDQAEVAYKALAELDRSKPEGRAVLADFYATVGRYDEATNIYQEAVTKSPDFVRGRYRLGELMLQRGDVAGAAQQVNQILQNNPNDLQARLLNGRIALQNGEPKKAIEDLKEVLKQDPRHKLGLYFMAEANVRAGQTEQARSSAGELERYHPDFLPGKLMQAQINLATGDPKSAHQLASELVERLTNATPTSDLTPQLIDELRAKSLTARGSANMQLGDLKLARADMEAALKAAPNTPGSYTNLAAVAANENRLDEAAQLYERALSIDRVHFDALAGIIKIYAATKRTNEAHARVDQALSTQPNNPALHYLKAQAYGTSEPGVVKNEAQLQEDARQAETALRRAIEIDPDFIAAYESLAALFVNLRQPDRALAEYHKIAERRPDDAKSYTMMGMVEESRGNYDAAINHYRRTLQIDPESPIAANNLAVLYADHGKGNLDEAVQMAQAVVRKFPNQPGFADTLGWVFYKKGLFQPAVEQLQKAVQVSSARGSDNALYRYHLGLALLGAGRKPDARRELQTAQRLAEQEASRGRQFAHAEDLRRSLASL